MTFKLFAEFIVLTIDSQILTYFPLLIQVYRDIDGGKLQGDSSQLEVGSVRTHLYCSARPLRLRYFWDINPITSINHEAIGPPIVAKYFNLSNCTYFSHIRFCRLIAQFTKNLLDFSDKNLSGTLFWRTRPDIHQIGPFWWVGGNGELEIFSSYPLQIFL